MEAATKTERFVVQAANVPGDFEAPGGNAWADHRDRHSTGMIRALRIEGPFETRGREHDTIIEDGWLLEFDGGSIGTMEARLFEETYEPIATKSPEKLVIGRIVRYITEAGYELPAIVTATRGSLAATEADLPELASDTHVHLRVFTVDDGTDHELDVPMGSGPGCWRWQER